MARDKLVSISWKAESYLMDVELLDRLVEFTYFRILNYIYLTQDRLVDDDEKVARLCKCKGVKEYRAHKAELLKPRGIDPATGEEIPPRIYISGGFIRSEKCTERLAVASANRAQKSGAGQASADAKRAAAEEAKRAASGGAKSRSHIYKESAVVGTANATGTSTAGQRGGNGRANGAATGDATEGPTGGQLPSTLNLKSTLLPPQSGTEAGAPFDEGAEVGRLADLVWDLTGQAHVGLRKRASGSVDDYRHVRKWLKQGFAPAEIEAAARAIIEGAGEITSVWGLLAKVLPEKVELARGTPVNGAKTNGQHADIPTVVEGWGAEAQITIAKAYLLEGELSKDGKTTVYDRAKPKAKRRWAFKNPSTQEIFPAPGEPGCPVHDRALSLVAEQFGAEWP